MTTDASPRRGGREARRATRAAPLAAELRPIWPGLEGGAYKPLKDSDIRKIHAAALDVLAGIGLSDAPPSGVELLTAFGAELQSNGRITFPRALVEDTIAMAARRFVLHGQDPRYDLEPWGSKVHCGIAGAAVNIVDIETRTFRESTTRDLYDIARVCDALENIHFFLRATVCRDLTNAFEMDVNTCYAAVSGTAKPAGTSWSDPAHMGPTIEMLHMIAGGEDKWRARPFVHQSNCFVVPPLKFATDACRCLEIAVREAVPVFLVSAGQAGATSPASLAGSLVQEMAECLAGLVYVNAVERGAKAIFGPYCFISDLRTGAMSGGSPEQALLSAAAAQMSQYYDLTCGTPAGMTDSKIPDAQSGYEKGYTHALVANAGANLVYESAGMLASLLGFSLEQLVIDNDIIGATMRTVRGIEVSDEAIALETIRSTCLEGPGHFLGSEQTLALMQKEYVYPSVGDRTSPKEWAEKGSTDVVYKAKAKLGQILSTHYPTHIPRAIDEEIRRRLPIRLPPEAMSQHTR
ncbi:MAG: trimethylamine methyltransferase family protein [Hyphomicrobiaceae bacterium]